MEGLQQASPLQTHRDRCADNIQALKPALSPTNYRPQVSNSTASQEYRSNPNPVPSQWYSPNLILSCKPAHFQEPRKYLLSFQLLADCNLSVTPWQWPSQAVCWGTEKVHWKCIYCQQGKWLWGNTEEYSEGAPALPAFRWGSAHVGLVHFTPVFQYTLYLARQALEPQQPNRCLFLFFFIHMNTVKVPLLQ